MIIAQEIHGWVTKNLCGSYAGKPFLIIAYCKERGLLVKILPDGYREEFKLKSVFLTPAGAKILGEIKETIKPEKLK